MLLLDGGDALQGSYTALKTKGGDMVAVLQELGVEATTGHWEFTLGAQRVAELFGGVDRPGSSGLAFLAGNVRDTDFEEPVFPARGMFERGGVSVAVIGQAFPYTPIANPRWMMPNWSFGIRETELRRSVAEARRQGAQVVVLLSHNGFDVDRKLATRVEGIDVILSAHTHDALPQPVRVGSTLLIASGSHGKFLSRLDIEVSGGRVSDVAYGLIPVLADAIAPDPEHARADRGHPRPARGHAQDRACPHRWAALPPRHLRRHVRRPHLRCAAGPARRRDRAFAGLPLGRHADRRRGGDLGRRLQRHGHHLSRGLSHADDGRDHQAILEDVADNSFNPDPYLQQGGDMVRVGGMGYTIDVDGAMGSRIANMYMLGSGAPIEPEKEYVVAGWGSVNEGTQGPPIWEVVAAHLKGRQLLSPQPRKSVKIVRAGG